MEIQQYITDENQISWIPQRNICQSKIEELKIFTNVNIGIIISETYFQNQQLQHWCDDYPPLAEHFDKLMQQIRDEDTILAASDGLYLEDRQALARWFFM